MARSFESFQSQATADQADAAGSAPWGAGGSPLSALRAAAARIGTTLDEDTTRAELTREAAAQVGAAAAVLRSPGEPGAEYEAVCGNPAMLPDARWVGEITRKAAVRLTSGGSRPALCVPVAVHDHRYGLLVCSREGAPFSQAEEELVTFLAERAAAEIRHAREHDAVASIVGKLQRALLAEPGRPHPNLDVAIRYLPVGKSALVGGDWCETVRLHFGRTLLVVGDVMGHGLDAAVDMTAYRSALRYIASADLPPHRVLRQLDDLASAEPERRPATCLIARVDPVRAQVTLASAGHLPPAVIDGTGRVSLLPVPVGPPLGTGLGGYQAATYPLDPSQALMLFTDGLVERRGEDIDHSLDRLARVGFSSATGVQDVLDIALARLDARHAEDDVAVLAARLHHR
ncbi:magnesium or manganese-dependent protein phosphatase [Streptomyces davaonensis JCM 4913]|uniref:Magnesium or manganese-dependent protein phosphatase n=1 Tax=Streptomyces davaonensis (strain DSM 101723 / JCM 4913 / KCC S-0913 / 768) TaxID=1214101 RepID=K4R207_STRDJ|nr:GAF domain-containing SpoIIE family protein phosphatase [Streptomyces davaonensis]CCK26709.1 magnesium or manganese-dependent protein phosphatase [Streptomyces davaonensis JCM 4913]